jgi:hypothetical protein
MIKFEAARQQIVAEWYPWAKAENITNANAIHGLSFSSFLQKTTPFA